MTTVIYLLTTVAVLGAADTLYYHEWRARLPAMGRSASDELRLHAYRDFVYAILFGTLPWLAWRGPWAGVLAALLLTETVLTMWDFVVEDWIRKPLGGVYAGERVMHGVMGIVYGAMLAFIVPVLMEWWRNPSGLTWEPVPVPPIIRLTMGVLALGVFLSGVRDFSSAYEIPGSSWPWKRT